MRTKWDILQEKRDEAKKELDRLEAEITWMQNTLFADGESGCIKCGETLVTEEDFAKHFLIPDERARLGFCPTDERYKS